MRGRALTHALVGGVVALSAFAASSASSARAPSVAALPAITWEGTITVNDRYTHEFSSSGYADCGGSTVSLLKATYVVAKQSARIIQPAKPRLLAKYGIGGQSASFEGSAACRLPECGGYTSTESISGAGRFNVFDTRLGGEIVYDRTARKLEFVGSANGQAEVWMPDTTWRTTYLCGGPTSGTETNASIGRSGGPWLENTPSKDYRLDVVESRDPRDPERLILRVKGSSQYLPEGNPAMPANGFPIGNYSNFTTLRRSPTSGVSTSRNGRGRSARHDGPSAVRPADPLRRP